MKIKVLIKLLSRRQYIIVFPELHDHKLDACDIYFAGLDYKDSGSLLDHASNEVWDYANFLDEKQRLIKESEK